MTGVEKASFLAAQANMDYDAELLATCSEERPSCLRLYSWKQPGITVAYHTSLPSDLVTFDVGYRQTGGGIVFHCPNDLMITHVLYTQQMGVKSLLLKWAHLLKDVFLTLGFTISLYEEQHIDNRLYCQTYRSPYEGVFEGKKVWGMAVRRFRDRVLLQIVIHVGDDSFFSGVPEAYRFYLPLSSLRQKVVSKETFFKLVQECHFHANFFDLNV